VTSWFAMIEVFIDELDLAASGFSGI